jgi:geranylgeranyl reductase family protein
MKAVDVVIVGAGPAGSATAIGLARLGYEVALIDKKRFPREKLCGDFINPINWPSLRELDVQDRVRAQPHGVVTGFRITTAKGLDATTAFEGDQSSGLGLSRALLDQVLSDRAAASGAGIHLGCRIEELFRTGAGWTIKTAGESWRAKFLIGADGRNSWVAQQLGLNRGAVPQGRSVGFQCRLHSPAAFTGAIEIHLFDGGYAGVVGIGNGAVTLGMAIDKRRLAGERGTEFLFERVLAQNPRLKEIIAGSDRPAELRSVYPVYFPPRRCAAERALLVGDAARVSEPVTGEGIYFAMRSGLLAAETIDRAARRGNLGADRLARYEHACRRAFRSRLALNGVLRRAVYRPALLEPVIRLLARNQFLLHSLVDAVCMP